MATEYGYLTWDGKEMWTPANGRAYAEQMAQELNTSLIAREVSEPRIVSIRA